MGDIDDEVVGGIHNYSAEERYVKPSEPEVIKQLEWFQDQKLALMMHWGLYSQLGIVESWALSDEDAEWSRNCIDWEVSGEEFKKEYFNLNKTFNPVRFQPELWADLAKEGGFKYFIFTTKHHDGFCMWDTAYTDYKITSKECPFHEHKYSDICKNLFDAMREKGLGIAAYFSKADWHIPYYWNNDFENGTYTWRGPSYKPEEHPELWQKFTDFTHNQVLELAKNYGRLDIMWFDAGWVRAGKDGQDIKLGELMDEVRKIQPWILSADRTVGGPYENYITPEQCVPEKPLNVPWESCITMGTSFSFKYEDKYKSGREIACLLVDIVAKGGNLALNVGPQPDGRIPEGAINTIKELGAWMKVYGEAIYGTRVCEPYKKDEIAFTQKKKYNIVYAFKMYKDENTRPEECIFIPYTNKIESIDIIGYNFKPSFTVENNGINVRLPKEMLTDKAPIAHVFKLYIS